MKEVCAFAPASIANLNVGFDVLGMSLGSPGDKVELRENGTGVNRITFIANGTGIPFETGRNCCTAVIGRMQETLKIRSGVDVRISKGFAHGSGLGSSSASSVAAAFAYNAMLDYPFSDRELVDFAAEGEFVACGTAHRDNVAAALMGGLVLISGDDLVSLPLPPGLSVLSFFPRIRIDTADSRSVLREMIPLAIVSRQVASMGAFVAGLYRQDYEMIANSLNDLVLEPTRKLFIPKYDEMKRLALENHALAFGISGSGPSVFAITLDTGDAHRIGALLHELFGGSGIETESFVAPLSGNNGARLADFDE